MARIWNPAPASCLAMGTIASLSPSRTLMNAVPFVGMFVPAATWLLAKASSKLASMPITSPVLRISGPRMMSTPGNLANGKTTSFTLVCFGSGCSVTPSSFSDFPAITFAAIFAQGIPVAFDTNGTVREARGLTSIT